MRFIQARSISNRPINASLFGINTRHTGKRGICLSGSAVYHNRTEIGGMMKLRFLLLIIFGAIGWGLATAVNAQTVEYLLVPVNVSLVPTDVGTVLGKTGNTFTTTSCSAMTDQFGNVITDPNFTGTAYQTNLFVTRPGSSQPVNTSVYVIGNALPRGTRLTGFTVLNGGETCTENINGAPQTFQKYQAVTCLHCGQPSHPHHHVNNISPFRKQH